MATQMVGRVRWSAERRFFTFMTLAIFAAVYVGFARTFFLRPWFPEMEPLVPPEPFFILHGAVFTAWFVVLLVGLAFVRRRDAQMHKRLMVVGSIAMIDAALARWPGVIEYGPIGFFALTDAFLVPLVIWDLRTRGRLHPATLWGGLLLIASQPLRLWLMGTDAWLALAQKVL